MAIIKSVGDFFAIDIGSSAIRVLQLTKNGQTNWSLKHFGHVHVDNKLTSSDSEESRRKLGEVIITAVGQAGISTKNVAVGLPSQKTFTTVIEVPTMSEVELKNSIRYQLDQYIPMAVDEAQVDWALLGQSAHDPKMQEVLLTSTAKSYSEERLELLEAVGFNVIAAEPDPLAVIRSLLPTGVQDARLIIDMGEHSTDIVVTLGDTPRLVRSIPTGLQTLIKTTVQNLNVKDDQARQFILKFGLMPDKLEGSVARCLDGVLDSFAAELTKSIKFFQTRYPSIPVSGTILSGYSGVIPELGNYIATKTAIRAELGNPWQHITMPEQARQQLAPVASEFTAVVGLAMRENKE